MPEQNTLEILIRARDQATQQLDQVSRALGQTSRAGEGARRGLQQFDVGLGGAIRSARVFAVTLISEANPALAESVTQFAAVAQGARFASTAVAAMATVGIAAAVAGLGLWISRTKEQAEQQARLNDMVKRLDVTGLQSQIRGLGVELDTVLRQTQSSLGTYLNFLDNVVGGLGQLERGEGVISATLLGDPNKIRARIEALKSALREVLPIEARQRLAEQRAGILGGELQGTLRLIGLPENQADVDQLGRAAQAQIELVTGAALEAVRAAREKALKEAVVDEQEPLITQIFLGEEAKVIQQAQRMMDHLRDAVRQAKKAAIVEERVESPRGDLSSDEEKLFQDRLASTAEAVARLKERFGPEAGLQAAIAANIPITQELLDKITEIERGPLRALGRFERALEEQQRQFERIGTTITNVFSDTLWDHIEGRAQSTTETLKRLFINFGRDASRSILNDIRRALFSLRPGGGGLLPFNLGQAGQIGGVAAAGVPLAVPGFGFTPTGGLIGQTGSIEAALNLGGLGVTGSSLSGIGSFLSSPIGGLGVSPLGVASAGLTGAGFGAAIFPQGGLGSTLGGALGGIGGAIGGAALSGALSIAATSVLSTIIPGVGAILGAVGGAFLGNLFGGDREKKKQQSLQVSAAANQTAASTQSAAQAWAQDHPILGPPLLQLIDLLSTYRTTTGRHAENQRDTASFIASLFAGGRVPSEQEIYTVLGHSIIFTGLRPALPLDAIIRQEAALRLEQFQGEALFELVGTQEGPIRESRILSGVTAGAIRAGTTGLRSVSEVLVGRGTIPDELVEALIDKINEFATVRNYRVVATEVLET